MELTQADTDLYNEAMDELGQDRISSFEEKTPAADGAARRYASQRDFCLSLYMWSWRRTTVELSRLTEPSPTPYKYQYALPAYQIMSVRGSADSQQYSNRFTRENGRLHTDLERVFAEHGGVSLDPANWSPTFRTAVVKATAASAAIQMTGNRALRRDLMAEAFGETAHYPRGGLIATAIAEDGTSEPGSGFVLDDGDLIGVRY